MRWLGMKIFFLLFFLFTYSYTTPLTPAETSLIPKTPLKCIATGEWAPFNLLEDDKLSGIGIEYWDLIQNKLGIQSQCHIASSWTEVLTAIKKHSADINIATQATKERSTYAVFSKPYATYPLVIVTRDDVGFIDNIQLLKGKKIAIGKSYSAAEILKKRYPYLQLYYVKNINEALSQVNSGEAFATIEIFPVVAYKLNKNTFPNLKISGSTLERFSVSFMLRKDYAYLLPQINKAIDAITHEEENRINQKWISIHQEGKISRKYFYILSSVMLVIISLFSLWLYRLKKEILEKNKATKRLQKLATIDQLTNIGNRYMCDLTLQKEISLAQRHHISLSLIFFDIDKFKKINDRYGHDVGDKILQQVASLVKEHIRNSDTFCRWGGDEFIIILPQTDKEEAEQFATQCRERVSSKMFYNKIPITCTYGTARHQKGDTSTSMISRADKEFYMKKKGKTQL